MNEAEEERELNELLEKGFVQFHRADLRDEGMTPLAVCHCTSIQRVEQSNRDESQSVLVMNDSKMVVADEEYHVMRDLWIDAKEADKRNRERRENRRNWK